MDCGGCSSSLVVDDGEMDGFLPKVPQKGVTMQVLESTTGNGSDKPPSQN